MLPKPRSCQSCIGWAWGCQGFVPADGTGDNGCLMILEAAGSDEALEGRPTVGKAGHYLWNTLLKAGIERDGWRIHNVLSCQPPSNKLVKQPYELSVIQSCAPNLERTIRDHTAHCKTIGKTPVIFALGRVAFRSLMGLKDGDPMMKASYIGYPHWSEKWDCWILAADHPSHIMQGAHHKGVILQFVAQHCLEIADKGITLDRPSYFIHPEPEPATFDEWVRDYFTWLEAHPDTYLSFDIETPYKQGQDEDEIGKAEGDAPGAVNLDVILRCSFSYKEGEAVSVPWNADYLPIIQPLMASGGAKLGWNSDQFDYPKVKAQMPIGGICVDGMLGWHVLNSSQRKSLGFVTPFYAPTLPMWKHLSASQPALYNAVDADAALRNWNGIKRDLKTQGLWRVFDRHVIQVHQVFKYMGDQGVLLDAQMRADAEAKLSGLLTGIEAQMEAAVPVAARKVKVYRKTPKDLTGMIPIEKDGMVKRCSICREVDPKKAHFAPLGAKATKAGKVNPCVGGLLILHPEKVVLWGKPLGFKVSKLGLTSYQSVVGHQPIWNRREGKTTFDESAIMRLTKKYPTAELYPLILDHRAKQKLLGNYIGVTQYRKVEVSDDYVLQLGEKFIED